MIAAMEDAVKTLAFLRDAGVDLGAPSRGGLPLAPVHAAAIKGHVRALALLRDAGYSFEDRERAVEVRRGFHTLKGSGRMVGARAVSEFAWSIESLLNRVINGTLPRSADIVEVMTDAVAELPGLVGQLANGGELPPAAGWVAARAMALAEGRDLATVAEPFLLSAGAPRPAGAPTIVTPITRALAAQEVARAEGAAQAIAEALPEELPAGLPEVAPEVLPESVVVQAPSQPEPQVPGFDPQLAEIYRAETASHLATIAAYLGECGVGHAPHAVTEAMHRACHTLAGASKMAEVPAGTALAEPLNLYIRKLYDHGIGLDADTLPVVQALAVSIGEVAARLGQPAGDLADHSVLLAQLDLWRVRLDAQITVQGLGAPVPEVLSSELEVAAVLPVPEAVDPEIASIFAEEASELLELADAALSAWRTAPHDPAPAAELKRTLHTLKGGARMAGLHAMGSLGHAAESLIGRIESTVDAAQVASLFDLLQGSLDHLAVLRDGILAGRYEPLDPLLLASLTTAVATNEPPPNLGAAAGPVEQQELTPLALPVAAESALVVVPAEPAPAQLILVETTPAEPTPVESVVPPPGRELQTPAEPRELARVDAELLDDLLNNAGEVSILRARLEQQWNSVESNLAELSRVTTRLKEQLRRLELETEAQILARHETDVHRGAFDPLEMDRYSSLHQYSRALAESASDVASLQSLLEQLTRDGQNLLMQQARSVSEMQNGLMRSRMVAFQRHVPRLSRLVRQVASESGKRAELVVTGASGELDRQVLERLVGPFEHLLRNAVVHGIELPAVREAAGKLAEGRIEVALHRENSEMVITVADDGAGLDLRAIRERARSRGLVAPGAVLTDGQAMQLVLEPGFSTATTLTADAGRGVGMDVVATAVKKLGGSLHMESLTGRGARFTLRLPFTLAISQALIVRTADELYALPLPTVEAVVRLTRSEVARHLVGTLASYEYGGQFYRFEHLGRFIGAPLAQLPEQEIAVPVVLVRSGENSTALVIDELLGNREVVVKAVGPQVASIEGIAGATILGDGRVVLILDMPTLVRRGARVRDVEVVQGRVDRRAFALVVDDSITVRRVTQRLLERHGMRVATARDGVDALTILQDHVPDVVLLDIEMPRMDGYELATQIRADARLRDVPIVMITSRVGEKHRAKAIEIGVDDYLGKPYQESQLLDAIEPLLARRQTSSVGLS
jgi:chemosensory pili system protein ChpA (sensor histidine kinase/response regulator)